MSFCRMHSFACWYMSWVFGGYRTVVDVAWIFTLTTHRQPFYISRTLVPRSLGWVSITWKPPSWDTPRSAVKRLQSYVKDCQLPVTAVPLCWDEKTRRTEKGSRYIRPLEEGGSLLEAVASRLPRRFPRHPSLTMPSSSVQQGNDVCVCACARVRERGGLREREWGPLKGL